MNTNDKLSDWQDAIREIAAGAAPAPAVGNCPACASVTERYCCHCGWEYCCNCGWESVEKTQAPAVGDAISFELVERVCNALSKLGVSIPESHEEQAARANQLIEELCDEVLESKQATVAGGYDAKSFEQRLSEYASDYQYVGFDSKGREGYYSPNDWERELIKDAIRGWGSESPRKPVTRADVMAHFPVSLNCMDWYYYPVAMPVTKDGRGPADYRDADRVVYEVWDRSLHSHSCHEHLYDAINEAMRLERLQNESEAQAGGEG